MVDIKPIATSEKKSQNSLIKDIAYVAVFFLLFSTFGWLSFHIPSSSMEPTLEVGDRIFVSKWAYGYNRHSVPFVKPGFITERKLFGSVPKRGDIAVFYKHNIDYIKRVIGLPGDTVQVREGRLYLNGKRIHRALIREIQFTNYEGKPKIVKEYDEVLPASEEGGEPVVHRIYEESDYEILDNTPLFKVPEGHVFMMGDNRDNSVDSRARVGFVRLEALVGEAQITTFSLYDCDQGKPIYCPLGIPLGRFFTIID